MTVFVFEILSMGHNLSDLITMNLGKEIIHKMSAYYYPLHYLWSQEYFVVTYYFYKQPIQTISQVNTMDVALVPKGILSY